MISRPAGASSEVAACRQSCCSETSGRLNSELKAHSTTAKPAPGRSGGRAMSPSTGRTRSAPGLAPSAASIAREASRAQTSAPAAASGSARRPVPAPISSTGPPPASRATAATQAAVSVTSAYHSS